MAAVATTRRARRSKSEMQDIRAGLYEILEDGHPMTVRQVFYQATTAGLVEKTELAYRGVVGRLLVLMRRDGTLPYHWLADGTRWQRKPSTYTGLEAFIDRHARAYRRDLWEDSDYYVEIWCEKEALAGTIVGITSEYDVPLMVSRGFASESYLYSAAEAIENRCFAGAGENRRCASIYYFGDHDPSGTKIDPSIESGIRRILASERDWSESCQALLTFERIAVTREQITEMDLPTRPTKLAGNAHARTWREDEESVELDAIPPAMLRELSEAASSGTSTMSSSSSCASSKPKSASNSWLSGRS
jgi:hypothetical protein